MEHIVHIPAFTDASIREHLLTLRANAAFFEHRDIVKYMKYTRDADVLMAVLAWEDYCESWRSYPMISKMVQAQTPI